MWHKIELEDNLRSIPGISANVVFAHENHTVTAKIAGHKRPTLVDPSHKVRRGGKKTRKVVLCS